MIVRLKVGRIIGGVDSSEFIPNWRFSGWLRLANRLQSLGLRVIPTYRQGRLRLVTDISAESLARYIENRATKKMSSRKFLILPTLPLIVVLAFVPLGSKKVIAIEKKVNSSTACSQEHLTGELRKREVTLPISNEVRVGGISSGVVECNHARYSYTLDRTTTKRVLKLVKLDS